jgi:hypothetical protein
MCTGWSLLNVTCNLSRISPTIFRAHLAACPVIFKSDSQEPDVTKYLKNRRQKFHVSYFQELKMWFHTYKGEVPESIHNQHPSIMCCSLLTSVFDQSVAKRLVTCLLAALRANGKSHFIFTEVPYGLYHRKLFTCCNSDEDINDEYISGIKKKR